MSRVAPLSRAIFNEVARLGRVESGYLQLPHIRDARAAARALDDNFDAIKVGVHEDAEVVLGHAWDGAVDGQPRIAQVFTGDVSDHDGR